MQRISIRTKQAKLVRQKKREEKTTIGQDKKRNKLRISFSSESDEETSDKPIQQVAHDAMTAIGRK